MRREELPEGAEILIVIGASGDATVSAKGVKGRGCLGLTQPFRDIMGGETLSSRTTAEYREEPENEGRNRQRR